MAREIVLDTETTGLDPQAGHRIIEIACVELEDYSPTGRWFHRYINPECEIDADAQRVHGISRDFLLDKPTFGHPDVVDALEAFVGDAIIIAHNAAFDRRFVDHELKRLGRRAWGEQRWFDSLGLAQKRFPGASNSLDALCKRFKVSLAEREKHGALIDAQLLARVYLELRGGREVALDLSSVAARAFAAGSAGPPAYGARPRALAARLTEEERRRHAAFVCAELKGALWSAILDAEQSLEAALPA